MSVNPFTKAKPPTDLVGFFVPGEPKPKGSMRIVKRWVIPDNPQAKVWEHVVMDSARAATDRRNVPGPLFVRLRFAMKRPKGHFMPDGTVRHRAARWHSTRGDIDKLARAVLDGITQAGIWIDDGQVAKLDCEKGYDSDPGCHVWIGVLHG